MKKYIEYFCENCNETRMDNEVFTNSLDDEETYYCQWCGCEVKEVNSYIDL